MITPASVHISNDICILARWHLFYCAMSRLFHSCKTFGKYSWYFCNAPAPILKSAICSFSKSCYEQTTTNIFLEASFSSWETDSAQPGDIRQPKLCKMERKWIWDRREGHLLSRSSRKDWWKPWLVLSHYCTAPNI